MNAPGRLLRTRREVLRLAGRGATVLAWSAGTVGRTAEVPQAVDARGADLAPLGGAPHLHGQSHFRYWGFHVYDAQLWVRSGFDWRRPLEHAFALRLIYARELRAQDIAERSLQEMSRQATVSADQSRRWLAWMRSAFVDVKPGDRLTGVYTPADKAAFYFNGQFTSELVDAVFAPLFFGIWLAPTTSEPALRNDLLKLPRHARSDRG